MVSQNIIMWSIFSWTGRGEKEEGRRKKGEGEGEKEGERERTGGIRVS